MSANIVSQGINVESNGILSGVESTFWLAMTRKRVERTSDGAEKESSLHVHVNVVVDGCSGIRY
jgi:hypothetical protein